MKLKLKYDKKEDIPEGYDALFTEKDGAWHLTGVEGMKTQADIEALQEGNRKEREDHKATKTKLKEWGDLKPEETLKTLDRIKELEAAAGGKLDEDKINEIVEGRIAQKTGPLEREIKKLTEANTTLTDENGSLKDSIKTRDLNDQVRTAATKAKVRPEVMDDMLLISANHLELSEDGKAITKDGMSFGAGLDLDSYFQEMQKTRSYWWPASAGGGAPGAGGGAGGGENPWSEKHWNLTKQGELVKADPTGADKMAKAANSRIGATAPTKKVA